MFSSPSPLLTVGLCALAMAAGGALLTTPTPGDLTSYFAPESFKAGVQCLGKPGQRAPAMDDFTAEWYGKVWRAADEPSLYLQSRTAPAASRRTYRFTWLRTFHAPVTVRLDERDGGRFLMTAKRLSGAGGYDPGHVADKTERLLTFEETRTILGVIEGSRISTAPLTLCDGGLDGSRWIFEGVENGKLHAVDRWTPEKGPIHDVGLAFLGLTGWKLEPLY